jgi:hypothetical protein
MAELADAADSKSAGPQIRGGSTPPPGTSTFGVSGIEIPRQQFVDAVDGMVGDTRQHLAQIGFGIETIEFRRTDQAVDGSGAFSTRV